MGFSMITGKTLTTVTFVSGVPKVTPTGYSLWNNTQRQQPCLRVMRVPSEFFSSAQATEAAKSDGETTRVRVEVDFADLPIPTSRRDAATKLWSGVVGLLQKETDELTAKKILADLVSAVKKLHVDANCELARLAKTLKRTDQLPEFISGDAPAPAPKTDDAAPKTDDAAPKTDDAAPKTDDAAPF
jgi:hypothetical protein